MIERIVYDKYFTRISLWDIVQYAYPWSMPLPTMLSGVVHLTNAKRVAFSLPSSPTKGPEALKAVEQTMSQ